METIRIIYFVVCIAAIAGVLFKHFWPKKASSNVENEETVVPPDEGKKDEDGLQYTLESVNSWLNNCDQKASILLSVIGVIITVLLTSDFFKGLRSYIFKPFVEYWTKETDLAFSWGRFTVFVLFVVSAIILIISCIYLFKAITATIDYDKMRAKHPELVKSSYIFFGSISKMRYEDFKKDEVDYKEDLKSQIYVNSIITTKKFENYNEGLFWFKLLLLSSGLLFVAIMFVE